VRFKKRSKSRGELRMSLKNINDWRRINKEEGAFRQLGKG
jgi:hypothetical protein